MNETKTTSHPGKTALVLGASGGLGAALFAELSSRPEYVTVLGVSRGERPDVVPAGNWFRADATEPEALRLLAEEIAENHPRIHLLMNCIGTLHGGDGDPSFAPEKALRQLRIENLQQAMHVNAFAPLAALQAFAPLLKVNKTDQETAVACVLSAMVGSITDNQLGGWYSYRMSKAALNMGLRNAAIEFARVRGGPAVIAVHPGTTLTALSEPFVSRHKHRPAEDSANSILAVIAGLGADDSGKFFNWDGRELPF